MYFGDYSPHCNSVEALTLFHAVFPVPCIVLGVVGTQIFCWINRFDLPIYLVS